MLIIVSVFLTSYIYVYIVDMRHKHTGYCYRTCIDVEDGLYGATVPKYDINSFFFERFYLKKQHVFLCIFVHLLYTSYMLCILYMLIISRY